MSDIRRINGLKRKSSKYFNRIIQDGFIDGIPRDTVTGSGLTYTDIAEKIEKIKNCASIIEMKEKEEKHGDGSIEHILSVAAANYCKQHAVCPVCADRLQSRRQARFNQPIRDQVAMAEKGQRHPYIITYTVTDNGSLADRLEHLKRSIRAFRLMGQRRGRGRRSTGEAGKIRAGIATIEIKRGDGSGEWHIHCHELAFSDKQIDFEVYDREKKRKLHDRFGEWIPKEELAKAAKKTIDFRGEKVAASKVSIEWLTATGGDSMGISIDPIRHVPRDCSAKRRRKLEAMSFVDSVVYQAKEVLKYPFKPLENNMSDAIEIIDVTYNKRMVATYGEFRGVPGDDYIDEALPEESTYLLTWNKERSEYGDPQPGKVRELIEEIEGKKARSQCGRITGDYRRHRRSIVSRRSTYGKDTGALLDSAKMAYRQAVRSVWALYRQAVESQKRVFYEGCDKYSTVIALTGRFQPGSTSRDVYDAAFAD